MDLFNEDKIKDLLEGRNIDEAVEGMLYGLSDTLNAISPTYRRALIKGCLKVLRTGGVREEK